MSRGGGNLKNLFSPIYEVMYQKGIIEKKMFSICLGKNGGYTQIGGYDCQGHLENVTWVSMLPTNDFKVNIAGVNMNERFIEGSDQFKVGFIDTGTTFAYLPGSLFDQMRSYFNQFCQTDAFNCKGRMDDRQDAICFAYDESKFPKGPITFFESFPIIRFKIVGDKNSANLDFNWYPSEYLYR